MANRPSTGCFAWTSPSPPRAKFQLTPRSASSTSRRLNAVSRRPRVDRPRLDPALRCIELSATRSSSAIRARTKLTTFICPLCRATGHGPCRFRLNSEQPLSRNHPAHFSTGTDSPPKCDAAQAGVTCWRVVAVSPQGFVMRRTPTPRQASQSSRSILACCGDTSEPGVLADQ